MKLNISIITEPVKPVKNKREYKEVPDDYKRCSILDKVKDYAKCVDSDEDSAKEWYYLQRLYEKLQDVKKLSKEQEQIVYIIEPLILKYNTNAKDIDGSKMLRGKDYLTERRKEK